MAADAACEERVEASGVGYGEFALEGCVRAFDGPSPTGDTGALKGSEFCTLAVEFSHSVEAGA